MIVSNLGPTRGSRCPDAGGIGSNSDQDDNSYYTSIFMQN
jgi:hypothetical protein